MIRINILGADSKPIPVVYTGIISSEEDLRKRLNTLERRWREEHLNNEDMEDPAEFVEFLKRYSFDTINDPQVMTWRLG